MRLIDFPFAKGDELIVNEDAGTLTVEIKAQILGNPEDVQLNFSIKTILLAILAGVTNPVLRFVLGILINLFA